MSGQQVNNRSGSKQAGFKNRSGSKQVGFDCYSNRSDSVSDQHQSVTDQVRVITTSGQTRGLKCEGSLFFICNAFSLGIFDDNL
ncbi:hypothetical protein GQ457_05G013260 [Hibiscus cannabinus]